MKICQFPHCGTVLRQEKKRRKEKKFTPRKFCSLHQRILNQNDIGYYRGNFYTERKVVSQYTVKKLKEIVPFDDFISDFESDKEAIKSGWL